MIVTTTSQLEGYQITRYIGIVSGEVVMGTNAIRDFLAG
ncbi:heavy metal-binding domain-containing protein, partial [Anaerospora hongkongensis]